MLARRPPTNGALEVHARNVVEAVAICCVVMLLGCGSSSPAEDGAIRCGGGASSNTETGCAYTWHDCSDGKSYTLKCLGVQSCSCLVDDVVTHTYTPASASDSTCNLGSSNAARPVANEACGWNIR
jgi:hypothetical protein